MISNDLTIEEIANLFHLVDQDKSGTLTRDEIILIMTQLKNGIPPNNDEINACMSIMDTNGDGIINEAEFLNAMIKWLNIVQNHNNNNPSHYHRKQTIQDMAKFFLQFSPIDDYQQQQKKILLSSSSSYHSRSNSSSSSDMDMIGVYREYYLFSSNDQASIYELIQIILSEGRDKILYEIYSLDWSIVLQGIQKVQTLLSIVEIFPTAEKRFEFSSAIFQIFDGVSQVDERDSSLCIIRRICNLLSPNVPLELQPTVYSPCLACLRNYITGPGLTPPISVQIDANNVWNQNNTFTRYVVESEGLPHRLLSILDQYYLDSNSYLATTSFANNPASVELLVHLLRCLSAFCEENTGCLEGMLRIGARTKIIQLLSNENYFHLSVIRSGLGCLAVLCGYTHTFHVENSDTEPEGVQTETKSIPPALQLNERELFDLLNLISTLMNQFILMSTATSNFDPVVVLNLGILCRFLLPLCPTHDPLYQSIFPNLIKLFHHPWTLTDIQHLNALISLDYCLLQLMFISRDICEYLWNQTNIHLILFNQLEHASETTSISISPILSTEISQLCLKFYSCLINYNLYDLFTSHKNYSFHKLCIHMVSHQHSEGYNDIFLNYLLFNLINSPLVVPIFVSLNIFNELFTIFIQFKHNTNTLSEIFHTTSSISSLYNIQIIKHLTLKLMEFFSSFPSPSSSSSSSPSSSSSSSPSSPYIQYLHIDHIERIQQLHEIIILELKKKHLKFTIELQQMTDLILEFLQLIYNSYDSYQCPPNEEIFYQKNKILSETKQLIDRWNIDLNNAYQESMMTPSGYGSDNTGMELVSSNVLPLLPNSRYSSNDLLIIAVPLWESCNTLTQYSIYATVYVPSDITVNRIVNGFCVMCQMNVIVNYLSPQSNSLTPLTTQVEFMNFYLFLQNQNIMFHSHVVMTLYLTQTTSTPPSHTATSTHTTTTSTSTPPAPVGGFNSISMSSYSNPFESNAYQLKQKERTLKNLQRTLHAQGKSFNMELMSLFYDYIRDCNTSASASASANTSTGRSNNDEITKEQFIAALTSEKLNYSQEYATEIFYSFDTDHNGSLSLTEISIGFAKLMNSNYDEKLELIFNAYDKDHNGVLDLEELIDMIQIATRLPYDEAKQYAIAVGNEVDENGNNTIEFHEFKEAVYKKLIPLEMAWSDSSLISSQKPFHQQTTTNIPPKFWNKSTSSIQSNSHQLPSNIFNSKYSNNSDFHQKNEKNFWKKSVSNTSNGSDVDDERIPLRRAFSADIHSVDHEDEGDPILTGIGMNPEEKERIYFRKRAEEEDELELKFLNRKQRSHSKIVFEDEIQSNQSPFSPQRTMKSSTDLHTFSSDETGPSYPQLSSNNEDENDEETTHLTRPPTPILTMNRKNSENQQVPTLEIITSTSTEDSKKRSSKEIAKSSPLPTPPEEKSAIRESKLKDIKKNPFSKSPK